MKVEAGLISEKYSPCALAAFPLEGAGSVFFLLSYFCRSN